jgi:hypothetical protein
VNAGERLAEDEIAYQTMLGHLRHGCDLVTPIERRAICKRAALELTNRQPTLGGVVVCERVYDAKSDSIDSDGRHGLLSVMMNRRAHLDGKRIRIVAVEVK